MRALPILAVVLAALMPCAAMAISPPPAETEDTATPMPAWEQLTQEQRDAVLAPLRARWNDNPETRGRMYGHAQRCQAIPSDPRATAHRRKQRWRHMRAAEHNGKHFARESYS